MADNLTQEDIKLIRNYLTEQNDIEQREPPQMTAADWDKVLPQIQATGEIPAEYRDRIGVREVKERKHHYEGERLVMDEGEQITKGYYDLPWERWNAEYMRIEKKYRNVVLKAIHYALQTLTTEDGEKQSIVELLKQIIDESKSAGKANLPSVITETLKDIDFPIDKVNRDIWGLLKYDTKGQLTFQRYNVAKKGSKQAVDILYSLDFTGLDNVSITRKLEPYDKRVYLAVAARFNAGYDVMTIQQIYNGMGYSGRAGASDIEKINAALTKMGSARLYIDNLAEANTYEYALFKYDGALLPMERIQAIINGQTAEAAIHPLREPPMVSFARERKQLTTVAIKLLDTPLNKTNANIALEDYLIEEIARIKKGSRSNKMLFKTIYENTEIRTAKQKQRAPEKIRQLLDYYKECGFIKAYKEMTDGVSIEF